MIPFKPTSQKPSSTNFMDNLLGDQVDEATAEVSTVLIAMTISNDQAGNGVQALSLGMVKDAPDVAGCPASGAWAQCG